MTWFDSVSGYAAAYLTQNRRMEELHQIWMEKLPEYGDDNTLRRMKDLKAYFESIKA